MVEPYVLYHMIVALKYKHIVRYGVRRKSYRHIFVLFEYNIVFIVPDTFVFAVARIAAIANIIVFDIIQPTFVFAFEQ